jgi:SAM-dependent methyltransferase
VHETSFHSMKYLSGQIASMRGGNPTIVLDVGCMIAEDGQPSYRHIIEALGLRYVGLDVAEGKNVDVVAKDPYRFPLEDDVFDLVISGQAFEHIEFPWATMWEIARVLKPGGIAVIIAPSSGPEHRYPQDCWRFYRDGMVALARWADLECIHASTNWRETKRFMWGDTVGIFWKHLQGAERPNFDVGDLHTPRPRQGLSRRIRGLSRGPLCSGG